jgi:hypothetical protein
LIGHWLEMVKKGKKLGKERNIVESAEVRRLGKWYGDAMQVMLEHLGWRRPLSPLTYQGHHF